MRLNFKFMQTDGVPLTADLMDQIQDAYAIFNVIGDIAGHLTILSGCEINGTLVTPGIVVINGDVLFFEGGTIYQTVFIHQEDITKVFKNQVSKVLIEKKTVKFGDSTTVYNWADFVRIDTFKQIKEALALKANQSDLDAALADIAILKMKTAPIINGGIVWIWKLPASEIPAGWKECTDLRGKTVFGRDPNDPDFNMLGNSAGNKTIVQTIGQMPKHSHSYTRTLPWSGGGGGFDGGGNPFQISGVSTSEAGNNEPMNILNPHRIVNFIEPNFI